MQKETGFDSLCVREIKENRTTTPHVLPIYATSSFAFDSIDQGMRIFRGEESGHVYSRFGNPTINTVAEKIARLEGHGLNLEPAALFFSSGMSAIHSLILGLLQHGDKILTQANLYGGTTEQFLKILKPQGIEPVFTDLSNIDAIRECLSDTSIKLIYGESPANPTMNCIDLKALADCGQQHGVYTAIDNTFMSPCLQQPFSFGVDFIIHSTTKYLNGHGNSTAGALVARDKALMQEKIWPVMKLAGTTGNPWDAWLVHNGMKTLSLRMKQHSSNALSVAQYLEDHSQISKVNYPGLPTHRDHELATRQMKGFGGMLSFEVSGGLDAAVSFMRKLNFCVMAPTMGDVDTLVLHPASMSHINIKRELRLREGITDGLVRLSVGIEDVEDIIADLDQALS